MLHTLGYFNHLITDGKGVEMVDEIGKLGEFHSFHFFFFVFKICNKIHN